MQSEPTDTASTERPILLAVDEDEDVLEAVEAQLIQRYAHDYTIEALSDPEDAVRRLEEWGRGGTQVALALAAAGLWDARGGELLERVRRLHPQAKRVLVVAGNAFADPGSAEAILSSMALGRIDHYVRTPAGWPDEVFHEAISSFLLDWATEQRAVPHTIHIVGDTWSGRAYELRDVFERCAVPHAFCLADSEQGRELLANAGPDAKLPLMVLPDGSALSDPSNSEIAQAAGTPLDFADHRYDVAIVGAGPAGLSAGVYGASEGLRTIVVDEGGIGGQARSSSLIRNYLGFPQGVSGNRLAEQAYEQASAFGAVFVLMHRVTALARTGEEFALSLSGGRSISARAVILATGASYRRLGVPSLEALTGAGVFYGGPASEAPGVRGKEAFIVGGANSAGQAALHLARYARRVTLVVRGASLEAGMSHYLVRELRATGNIEWRTGTEVSGGGGEGRLEELVLRSRGDDDEVRVAADALFVLIGADPHTDWLPAGIARDPKGFLLTGDEVLGEHGWALQRPPLSLETSLPGVLAAGDVRRGAVRRVASAVGEGSIAVQLVHGLLAAPTPDRVAGPAAAQA